MLLYKVGIAAERQRNGDENKKEELANEINMVETEVEADYKQMRGRNFIILKGCK